VARSSVQAVRGRGTADQRRQVERWLNDAITKQPHNVMLPVLLAELYDTGGRYDDALGLYRRILKEAPGNVVALNNLAYTLALRGDGAGEAVTLVNRAIDAAGPVPELLDTRAVVYLMTQQTDLAVKDLRQAIAQAPDPVKYYHLAAAEYAAKNRAAAGDAFRKATDDGLKPADLHPLEQAAYRQLADQLRAD
jgi:Tfp pilus assembly protein PilF